MKALKQVKETGIYKEPQVAQESTESSSDDEPSGVMKFSSDEADSEGAVDSQSYRGTPLMVLYDCESTSADIYKDHITEIAAIVHLPVSMKRLDFRAPLIFQSLVSTSRRILPIGKYNLIFAIFYSIFYMH